VGNREVNVVGQGADEFENAVELGDAADFEGSLILSHAGGFSAGKNESFHAW
jgi:hypothetical protein